MVAQAMPARANMAFISMVGLSACRKPATPKATVSITNKNLVDPIRAAMEGVWQSDKRYRVRGFWVADAKTMCFDLSEGVQEDYRNAASDNESEE